MKYLLLFLVLGAFTPGISQERLQDQIDNAFMSSFMAQENKFGDVIAQLTDNAPDEYGEYWLAYAYYRSAIFHMASGQMEKAQEVNNMALALLEEKEGMDSEEHALLASVIGLSIAFDPGKAMVLSGTSTRHFTEALELNDQNMRAHLGIGRGDFYRPVEYGGGQVAEMHLQKALSLPTATSDAFDAPSWGRDEVFMTLAMYYQREGRKGEGILTCKRGLKEFPGHTELERILAELEQS